MVGSPRETNFERDMRIGSAMMMLLLFTACSNKTWHVRVRAEMHPRADITIDRGERVEIEGSREVRDQ